MRYMRFKCPCCTRHFRLWNELQHHVVMAGECPLLRDRLLTADEARAVMEQKRIKSLGRYPKRHELENLRCLIAKK